MRRLRECDPEHRYHDAVEESEEGLRRILMSLDFEELKHCGRLALNDLQNHRRELHQDLDRGRTIEHVMAKLFAAGESPRNEALAEFLAQDDPARPPDPSQRRDMMRSAVLTQVNTCWLHMTEGHAAPGGTERDYLDSLVGRLGTE
jgi:hypothetical protein